MPDLALSVLIGRIADDAGLHPRHLQLLALLVERKELTISEAMPLLGVTQPQTQRLANRLVELGFATRRADDKALRFIYAPSPSGAAVDAQARNRVRAIRRGHHQTTTEDTAA
jgi:DNA-binding MarR family transcriptional regulator